MALLKYFKRAEPKKNEKIDAVLPKVDGPLAAGNDRDTCTSKRCGKYQFFTPKEKAEYGKRAATYGITSTIRYFAKVDKQERTLSPSTIFAWKEGYLKELAKRKRDEVPDVELLPPKKRGCPLLLGV